VSKRKRRSRRGAASSATLSHLGSGAQARMVDVSAKAITSRQAVAEAWVDVGLAIARRLRQRGGLDKGNVLETARLAGILAAKKTFELIPMCHPLPLGAVDVEAELQGDRIRLTACVRCEGRTGVEMEALTAAAVAALTVYDMVKSAKRGVQIGPIRLLAKRGGRSGLWHRTGRSR
jgi:cyclic pyranopterin phosphate synthase